MHHQLTTVGKPMIRSLLASRQVPPTVAAVAPVLQRLHNECRCEGLLRLSVMTAELAQTQSQLQEMRHASRVLLRSCQRKYST